MPENHLQLSEFCKIVIGSGRNLHYGGESAGVTRLRAMEAQREELAWRTAEVDAFLVGGAERTPPPPARPPPSNPRRWMRAPPGARR